MDLTNFQFPGMLYTELIFQRIPIMLHKIALLLLLTQSTISEGAEHILSLTPEHTIPYILELAFTNNIGGMEAFLQAGANANEQSLFGTPLFLASHMGFHEMVTLLLEAQADPELAWDEISPLFIASCNGFAAIVRELLRCGANQSRDYQGRTPLFAAAFNGHLEVVEFLMNSNPDSNLGGYNAQALCLLQYIMDKNPSSGSCFPLKSIPNSAKLTKLRS